MNEYVLMDLIVKMLSKTGYKNYYSKNRERERERERDSGKYQKIIKTIIKMTLIYE